MKEPKDQKVSVDRGVRLMNTARGEVKSWCRVAYNQGHDSNWLGQQAVEVIGRLPGYPLWIRAGVRDYFSGYRDAVEEQQVRFLYRYREEFYSVSGSKDTGYPSWDTLDREVWATDEWSKCGGLYWIYPDREPALFFSAAV